MVRPNSFLQSRFKTDEMLAALSDGGCQPGIRKIVAAQILVQAELAESTQSEASARLTLCLLRQLRTRTPTTIAASRMIHPTQAK